MLLMAATVLFAAAADAARKHPRPGPGGTYIERYLLEFRLPKVSPQADRFGPAEGQPPSMPLYQGDTLIGYAFDTWDVVSAVGYSRKPFHILGGMDLQGRLTGTALAWHVEPITSLGRNDRDLQRYLNQFDDHDVRGGVRVMFDGAMRQGARSNADRQIDGVSRVTTSSMLFADAILRSARLVARSRGIDLSGGAGGPVLDVEKFEELTWPELEAEGSIAHRAVPAGSGAEDGAEVELWAALVDPAGIGVHLLGRHGHGRYMVGRSLDDSAVFVATGGAHSLLPRSNSAPAPFPALQIVQGETAIRLTRDRFEAIMYYNGKGRPRDVGQGIFRLSAEDGFNPVLPWRLELALTDEGGGDTLVALDYALPARFVKGEERVPEAARPPPPAAAAPDRGSTVIERSGFRRRSGRNAAFGARPRPPADTDPPPEETAPPAPVETVVAEAPVETAVTGPPAESPVETVVERSVDTVVETVLEAGTGGAVALPQAAAALAAPVGDELAFEDPGGPDWRAEWEAQRVPLILLAVTLAVLFVILSLQEAIVRRHRLHVFLRVAFLAWIVGWLGWVAGAQLSVLHIINWLQSVEIGFDLAFFLMEPLIFTITVFVAISALLWGRAAFCGWLCPFGALQELLNRLAVRLRIPQIPLPAAVAERLTALKYLIFVGLAALTFLAVDLAYAASSVEPFKTAITFRFDAPVAAVLYALALLGIGLTIERFYCRFVCPLGAGLAILGRLRMFDWLKRRAECGNPCSRCEKVCPVGAIRKDGTIDMNECFYCLDCQVVYYDSHQCPPLVKRRRRLEAARPRNVPALARTIEPASAPEL